MKKYFSILSIFPMLFFIVSCATPPVLEKKEIPIIYEDIQEEAESKASQFQEEKKQDYEIENNKNDEIVEEKVEDESSVNLENTKPDIRNQILEAVQSGNIQMLKELLDMDESLFWYTDDSSTAIHHAVKSGNIEIVRILLENGAKVNALGPEGYLPLHWAAYYGYFEIALLLIDNGAVIEHPVNSTGYTPLHIAAENDHPDVVRLLLERGVSYNARNNKGYLPSGYRRR